MKIFLRLYSKGKVKRFVTDKKRRILSKVKAVHFEKAYVRVNYGYGKNALGQKTLFHNDGTYFNKSDLRWAINAFTEDD